MVRAWKWFIRRSDTSSRFGNVAILAFIILQCLDGVFTYVGIAIWGPQIEANPTVILSMSVMGVGLGLFAFKLVSVGAGILLYLLRAFNSVAAITVFGLVFAIFPWIVTFLHGGPFFIR